MKQRCPICDHCKKVHWLVYIQDHICKSCHSYIDMDIVNDKLPFIILESIKSQKRFVENYIFCIGAIFEELIEEKKITSKEYLSCSNYLIKEKVIYECYLFKQFAFETEIINLSTKKDVIKKLESYLPSVYKAVP